MYFSQLKKQNFKLMLYLVFSIGARLYYTNVMANMESTNKRSLENSQIGDGGWMKVMEDETTVEETKKGVSYRIICLYFPGLLAGLSGIRVGWGIKQWQIRGRKAPNFGWATFGWASCNLCPLCIALDFVV